MAATTYPNGLFDAVAAVSKRLRRDGEFFVYGHIGPGRSRRCFKEIEAEYGHLLARNRRGGRSRRCFKEIEAAMTLLPPCHAQGDAVAAVSKRLRRPAGTTLFGKFAATQSPLFQRD